MMKNGAKVIGKKVNFDTNDTETDIRKSFHTDSIDTLIKKIDEIDEQAQKLTTMKFYAKDHLARKLLDKHLTHCFDINMNKVRRLNASERFDD